MFLAINELVKEKARFILIVAVIALVGYLTFFLTALAYGLATSYTQGIEKWEATGIVLQKDANDSVARSILTKNDYGTVLSDDTALLGVGNATIEADTKEDVALFGIDQSGRLAPNITDGRAATSAEEMVVSDALQRVGVKLGQALAFKGADTTYKVVGFTDRATFQTAPIVYMQLGAWRQTASEIAGMQGMRDDTTVVDLEITKLVFGHVRRFSLRRNGFVDKAMRADARNFFGS